MSAALSQLHKAYAEQAPASLLYTPDMQVATDVLILALVAQLVALYKQLSLPCVVYAPAMIAAWTSMLCIRLTKLLPEPALSLVKPWVAAGVTCLLLTGVIACASASTTHFFCVHKLFTTAEEVPYICSSPWADVLFLSVSVICLVYLALCLITTSTFRHD
jgi:hypothetical protein